MPRPDCDPSFSVILQGGARQCHGCGAKDGVSDAATARRYFDSAAVDLMVANGVAEYRPHRRRQGRSRPAARSSPPRTSRPPSPWPPADDADVTRWQTALAADTGPHSQADAQSRMALRHDARTRARSRLRPCHIPVRDDIHRLVGLRRYQPWPAPGEPKMLAAPGSHRALLPHPAAEASEQVPLVEGEPDMIAARSRGLPAVAVPGVDGWRTAWASLFAGWRVVEVMHCDEDGRAAAAITNDIKRVRPAGALDRAPQRLDGHDLTDQLPRGERLEIHWP